MPELRQVDPKTLKANPQNPRKVQPPKTQDDQLDASIKAIGIIQPPIVREIDGKLVIRAGDRRRAAAVRLGLPTIDVLIAETDAAADTMIAAAENLVRASMAPTDIWRAIERMETADPRWNEQAIADALALPLRVVRRFKTLARVHKGMLKVMEQGVMPTEEQLRVIAAASEEEQAEVWKRHKPKKGEFGGWAEVARALSKRRMMKANALFDDALAAEFGITWVEDLFAPADEDGRYTTQVDEFLAAQGEHLRRSLPEGARILPMSSWGQPDLPKGAYRCSSSTEGAVEGHAIDERSGNIVTVHFMPPAPPKPAAPKGAEASTDEDTGTAPARSGRADVSQKGVALIGQLRTAALQEALLDAPLDDAQLIALLVLAFAGDNVSVQSTASDRTTRGGLAARLTEGGVLTSDVAMIRDAARRMLASVLSLEDSITNSGRLAVIAGETASAERRLPSMATEEFLSTLSKPHLERLAAEVDVLPRPTGKATRAAMVTQLSDQRWLHPAARFVLSDSDLDALADQLRWSRHDVLPDVRAPAGPASGSADGDPAAASSDAAPSEEGGFPPESAGFRIAAE